MRTLAPKPIVDLITPKGLVTVLCKKASQFILTQRTYVLLLNFHQAKVANSTENQTFEITEIDGTIQMTDREFPCDKSLGLRTFKTQKNLTISTLDYAFYLAST